MCCLSNRVVGRLTSIADASSGPDDPWLESNAGERAVAGAPFRRHSKYSIISPFTKITLEGRPATSFLSAPTVLSRSRMRSTCYVNDLDVAELRVGRFRAS